MWGPEQWKSLYQSRADELRALSASMENNHAKLVLLQAARDYALMAEGQEPDEVEWRPAASARR